VDGSTMATGETIMAGRKKQIPRSLRISWLQRKLLL